MAPFCIVDIAIPPPCVPSSPPPQINIVVFRLLQTTLIRGSGDLRRLNKNEVINE